MGPVLNRVVVVQGQMREMERLPISTRVECQARPLYGKIRMNIFGTKKYFNDV